MIGYEYTDESTLYHDHGDHPPSGARTANQIKVIAGKSGFFTMLLNPNSLHDLLQYEEFGQAAYTTPV